MENINESLRNQPIKGFQTMSKDALVDCSTQLGLHMTIRDLTYCQNQFRMRERRDPSAEDLLLLDALWTRRVRRTEFLGLRSFYTSDPMIAETYADLIAKATRLRREDRPYTPYELKDVLSQTLAQAGASESLPALCTGTDAPLRLLTQGRIGRECAVLDEVPVMLGHTHRPVTAPSAPRSTDQLLLLLPDQASPAAFAAAVAALPIPSDAQMLAIGKEGLFEALLTWEGVYLVQQYLPALQGDAPLSALIGYAQDGLLIRIDGTQAAPLRDAAARSGLIASIIGKWMPNKRLTIRREGETPWQMETGFLRAFSPTLPVDVEIPEQVMPYNGKLLQDRTQTLIPNGDCVLYATAIPDTPRTLWDEHVLTGASAHTSDSVFRSAMMSSLYAIGRAVACGADYSTVTLSNHLRVPHTKDRNADAAKTLAALLGAYRVQAELGISDTGGCFADAVDETAQLTIFAAAPRPENVISQQFSRAGDHVYLLTPQATEQAPVDFEDLRALLRYVHTLCQNGIARAVAAVGEDGVLPALRLMAQNGIGLSSDAPFPRAACGFIIEATQPIQGQLIGITSSIAALRVGEQETEVRLYRTPSLTQEQIPMSRIGVDSPTVCVPLVRQLGNITALQALVEKHHGKLAAVPMYDLASRAQLTALANTMACAQLTVLVGTGAEIAGVLTNVRVAQARRTLLENGGILLCLHTDLMPAKNQPIPPQHPLFFGVSPDWLGRDTITFGEQEGHEVHMRVQCAAIPRMIACGMEFFR